MKTLKILAAPLALAAATATLAGTAEARPAYGHGWQLTPARNAEIRQDINQLNNQIDRAAARRTISRREATGLHRQARNVQRLYRGYQRNGLNRAEVRYLQDRVNQVRVALRMERRDWDNRRG
jgi:Spy/CpxP family protein refolding chaperone